MVSNPVENRPSGSSPTGPRTPRWTSRLGLERATTLQELFLETEPEWRLYEDLRAGGLDFSLRAGPIKVTDPDDPQGRANFVIGDVRIEYRGAAGFAIKPPRGEIKYVPGTREVVAFLRPFSALAQTRSQISKKVASRYIPNSLTPNSDPQPTLVFATSPARV